MSEFTDNHKKRADDLSNFMFGLMKGEKGIELVKKHNLITENYIPVDILMAFDNVFEVEKDIEKIKIASNKLFNILYKTLNKYPAIQPKKNSFLYYLNEDNKQIDKILKQIRPLIKQLNKEVTEQVIKQLINTFSDLLKIDNHYAIKENILFPALEKEWQYFQCIKLMWSFHDDIRRKIKEIISILENENFNIKEFNRISAEIYFNIYTIIFREEKVLNPVILESFNNELLENMLAESMEIGFSFIKPAIDKNKDTLSTKAVQGKINLPTGSITTEQIQLIFNHLPVDITFVDENDKVQYFSTPRHRIFPRTKAIIGRDIRNCHPPESVHVVTDIVESFRKGKEDSASFWIKMKKQYILIRYFAVRDEENEYKGVLEVSQEISKIQAIKGEKRILDWSK